MDKKKEKTRKVDVQQRFINVAITLQGMEDAIIHLREEVGLMNGLLKLVMEKVKIDAVEKDIFEEKNN